MSHFHMARHWSVAAGARSGETPGGSGGLWAQQERLQMSDLTWAGGLTFLLDSLPLKNTFALLFLHHHPPRTL